MNIRILVLFLLVRLPKSVFRVDVRTDFNRFLGLYKSGKLDLDGMISRRIKLDEVNDALGSLGDADVIRQVIDF